jgi:hypothetical protein
MALRFRTTFVKPHRALEKDVLQRLARLGPGQGLTEAKVEAGRASGLLDSYSAARLTAVLGAGTSNVRQTQLALVSQARQLSAENLRPLLTKLAALSGDANLLTPGKLGEAKKQALVTNEHGSSAWP